MVSQNSASSVIELLARNEEVIEKLYTTYAERFTELQDFWVSLAIEERGHAVRLRDLGEKVSAKKFFFKADRFKAPTIRNVIAHTEREITQAGQSTYKLINALSIAYYLEESLIEKKFFEAFESDSPLLKDLLSVLEADTKKHALKIKNKREEYASRR